MKWGLTPTPSLKGRAFKNETIEIKLILIF
jgi:hypothetical protein